MDEGDQPEETQNEEPPIVQGKSSSLPWVLFILATLVLGGLAGYFARRVSQESTRADISEAERRTIGNRAKEQDKALESLQVRVKELTEEVKRAAEERESLEKKVKTLEEGSAAKAPAAAAKKPVAKKPPKKRK